jgi:hypothetical protein
LEAGEGGKFAQLEGLFTSGNYKSGIISKIGEYEMKKTRLFFIMIVSIVLLFGLAVPGLAAPDAPPLPSSFYGEIHFQSGDGGPSTDQYVEAHVTGVTGYAARTPILNSGGNLVYAINVPGDDPETTGVEGGVDDGTVTFLIGTRVVATGTFHSGTNFGLNIHPPKANAGGPYAGVVGETLTFSGSATDWFTSETFTYAWDLDNDDAYDNSTAQNPSLSFATTGVKTIKLQVMDSQSGIGTASATVVVVTLGGLAGQTYDGAQHAVTVEGLEGGVTVSSITYNGSATAPTNAGTYTVVVTFSNGATITKTMTIAPKDASVTPNAASKVYGDADPALSGTLNDFLPADGVTATYSRTPGETVAGSPYVISASLSATGLLSNYNITYNTANFTITAKPITVTADSGQTKVYGDDDPALTYTVLPDLVVGDSFTGALSRVAGENVGAYAITQGTLSAGGNYAITFVSANFNITAKSIAVTAEAKTKVYGDADPALTYTFTPALVAGDSFSGALSRVAGENVGPYAILQGTLALSSNYTLDFTGANLTINLRPITITADNKSKVYLETDPALTYTITSGSLAFSDTVTGALVRALGETVGAYAINQGTLALNTNYDLDFVPGTFTINAGAVTVTVTPGQSKVYGTADPVYAYTYSPTTPAVTFTGALSRVAGENAGTYAITQGTLAAANYTITFVPADFTITKDTATVALSNLIQVRDGTPKAVTVTTVPTSLSVDVTYDGLSTVPSAYGTYAVVATVNDTNYQGSASGTLYILESHSLTLKPGWNLVSFNLQPYPSAAPADVLASLGTNFDLVYAWDATGAHPSAGNWMKYDRVQGFGHTLTSMAEAQGFWIHITAATDQTLVVAGLKPTTTSIGLLTTASGWNLIGFPSTSNSTPLSGEVDYPADPTSLIYAYHAADTIDPWKLYDYNGPGYANDLTVLSPDYGYWVYVINPHTWNITY